MFGFLYSSNPIVVGAEESKKAEEEADRQRREAQKLEKKHQFGKDQEKAQAQAGKDLLAARSKQDRRRSSGRDSTIATGGPKKASDGVSTGGSSTLGGMEGRKSLLGL